jgi:protein-S-isoprenylcysteine O-methyltransferase Ste14
MAWGIVLLIATPKALTIALWITIVLVAWAKLEEWGLQQKFGQVYIDYKKTTPMIIPFRWLIKWLIKN